METRAIEIPDVSERGGPKDGQPQTCDRRLFMQLLVYGDCHDSSELVRNMTHARIPGVIFEDLNDPKGVAVLTFDEDPNFFVTDFRRFLNGEIFARLVPKPQYTMFGRTYSLGHEADLEDVLLRRPVRTACNPDWPWAIWYPLRRRGTFTQLPDSEQRQILMEHGKIGMAFGRADLAHDIRLACHGLDRNDNDFVIGLTGKHLHPLSAIVQTMRKTQQTSMYLENLGPFFIGKAIWQQGEALSQTEG